MQLFWSLINHNFSGNTIFPCSRLKWGFLWLKVLQLALHFTVCCTKTEGRAAKPRVFLVTRGGERPLGTQKCELRVQARLFPATGHGRISLTWTLYFFHGFLIWRKTSVYLSAVTDNVSSVQTALRTKWTAALNITSSVSLCDSVQLHKDSSAECCGFSIVVKMWSVSSRLSAGRPGIFTGRVCVCVMLIGVQSVWVTGGRCLKCREQSRLEERYRTLPLFSLSLTPSGHSVACWKLWHTHFLLATCSVCHMIIILSLDVWRDFNSKFSAPVYGGNIFIYVTRTESKSALLWDLFLL